MLMRARGFEDGKWLFASSLGLGRKLGHIYTELHCPISPSFVRSGEMEQK